MDTAFMGLTSSRDVTVSRTLSARTSSHPTIFLPTNLAGRQCTHLPRTGPGFDHDLLPKQSTGKSRRSLPQAAGATLTSKVRDSASVS
jgi:hypothetical protein